MAKFPIIEELFREASKEGNELLFLGSALALLFLGALAAGYYAIVGP